MQRNEAPAPRVFPPQQTVALMMAAQAKNWHRIDEITDELVELGFCRPRRDASLFQPRARSAMEDGGAL